MGLLLKALGKTPSAGLPYARDGVLPFNGVPTACPFWVGDPLARLGGRSRAWDVEIVGNTITYWEVMLTEGMIVEKFPTPIYLT